MASTMHTGSLRVLAAPVIGSRVGVPPFRGAGPVGEPPEPPDLDGGGRLRW